MQDGNTIRRKREQPAPETPDFLRTHRASLVLVEGPGIGREWELDRARLQMGRGDDVDLSFPDDTMSKEHAAFEALNDAFRVRDLGSTNGVLLNGEPVLVANLAHGDRIQIGEHVFQYLVESRTSARRVHVIDDD